jgi:hypothetical protein
VCSRAGADGPAAAAQVQTRTGIGPVSISTATSNRTSIETSSKIRELSAESPQGQY